jgi:hypothetical protein
MSNQILNSETRNLLFSNLKKSGFSQEEATKIIADKYSSELFSTAIEQVNSLLNALKAEDVDVATVVLNSDNESVGTLSDILSNLKKMKSVTVEEPQKPVQKENTNGKEERNDSDKKEQKP